MLNNPAILNILTGILALPLICAGIAYSIHRRQAR
jgi:hypothetical protein